MSTTTDNVSYEKIDTRPSLSQPRSLAPMIIAALVALALVSMLHPLAPLLSSAVFAIVGFGLAGITFFKRNARDVMSDRRMLIAAALVFLSFAAAIIGDPDYLATMNAVNK